jgi:hypothetical protein
MDTVETRAAAKIWTGECLNKDIPRQTSVALQGHQMDMLRHGEQIHMQSSRIKVVPRDTLDNQEAHRRLT